MCNRCAGRFIQQVASAMIAALPVLPVEIKSEDDQQTARAYDFARALQLFSPSTEGAQPDVDKVTDFLTGLGPSRMQGVKAACHYVGTCLNLIDGSTDAVMAALVLNGDEEAAKFVEVIVVGGQERTRPMPDMKGATLH